MDHLDLETILSSSSATSWMLPSFDQQDANFLSASRQMLEPIMEETSEDEENQNWPQYENVWSSESETGSVIRIELHNDQDAISERDFACPAKRPRRDDLIIIEGSPPYRKYSQQRNDILTFNLSSDITNQDNCNYRKRFDEFYSDSDSLSYNSLSRSSSLIQFESLEKQLQNDIGTSSLGNSSPSLLSIENNCNSTDSTINNTSNKGSTNCLKRFESSEAGLHQTFYNLDKIEFNNSFVFNDDQHHRYSHHNINKSDSESSDNSILSHEERIPKPSISSSAFIGNHNSNDQRSCYKGGRSSVENLSEDSGYCEHTAALKIKSKSIPNFLRHNENFSDHNCFENHKSLELISTKREQSMKCNSDHANSNECEYLLLSRNENAADQIHCENQIYPKTATKTSNIIKINGKQQEFKTKIDAKQLSSLDTKEADEEKQRQHKKHKNHFESDGEFVYWFGAEDQAKNKIYTNRQNNVSTSSALALGSVSYTSSASASSSSPSSSRSSCRKISSQLYQSSSLPDVRTQFDHVLDVNNLGNNPRSYEHCYNKCNLTSSDLYCSEKNNQFTTISSLPNDLNIILSDSILSDQYSRDNDENNCEFVCNLKSKSNKSENKLSNSNCCYSTLNYSGKSIASSGQNYMNASYNNLTLLDYSGRSRSNRNSFTMSEGSGNSKRNSREFELGKGNFLLDEISSHFDRSLSILSDRTHDSDLVSEFLQTEKTVRSEDKPKPPVRKSSLQKEQNANKKLPTIEKPPRRNLPVKTFDRDPTILKTNYTESLEKCNFDPKELSNTDLTQITSRSTPIKRGFVASTPNLNTFRHHNDEIDDDLLHVSSAHTSMNPLPSDKKLGILLSDGSRTSLSKGVSFCPVVSEISWREQSSEENMDPDSLENVQRNKNKQVELNYFDPAATNTDETDANLTLNITDLNQVNNSINNIQNNNQTTECDQQQQKCETEFSFKPSNLLNNNAGLEIKVESTDYEKQDSTVNTVSNVLIVQEKASVSDCVSSEKVVNKYSEESVVNDIENNNNKMLNCAKVKTSDDQKHGNNEEVNAMNKIINDNKNVNNNNNVGVKSATMPMISINKTTAGNKNKNVGSNTGTDLLSSKFKPKSDEKQHKNGFLSRFTGGFRFSLRRKKKSSPSMTNNDLNINDNVITSYDKRKCKNNTIDVGVRSSSVYTGTTNNSNMSNKSPDFIYIPLKGPLPGRQFQQNSDSTFSNSKNQKDSHLLERSESSVSNTDNNYLLLGKPPLPKQPPRVVGVCEKIRACPQQQQNISNYGYGASIGGYRHAPGSRSSSQPREIEERFLHNERQYYAMDNSYQSNGTMNENGCTSPLTGITTIITSLPPLPPTKCPATRPTGISIGSTIGPNGNTKIGLIETNLDTHETIISGKTRSLMELGPQIRHTLSKQSAGSDSSDTTIIDGTSRRPHKSMEFLLDKENQRNAMPPENELQKSHDSTAALSEHQLRVQASLQRLNIPDWFRQYSPSQKPNDQTTTSSSYKPGNFTRKRASDSGRWTGLNSKTTSLSSLGSQRSDRSPLLLSPSAHSHHGGQVGFSRWSTSHLNSTQTSPSVSTRGSFSRGTGINSSFISGHSIGSTGSSIRNSFRQPYLGWRSQEKLTSPRTPHERLASTLLAQKPPKSEPAVTPEIQTSIKEVTSAIVHYVNDQTNRTARSRSSSPNSSKCWLESSFVGVRPLDSPQTPIIDNSFNTTTTTITTIGGTSSIMNSNQSDMLHLNGVATPLPSLAIASERSPSSASLEDVLASLLGLPTDSYRSTGDSANEMMTFRTTTKTTTTNSNLQVDSQNRFRRRSEGDAQKQQQQPQQPQQLQQPQQQKQPNQRKEYNQQNNQLNTNNDTIIESSLPANQPSRRVSLDSSESKTTSELLIKCRNTKCDQATNPVDAKKYYKSCHNCSHLYCSRECRRTHWEKHRKACLHSRVSNLCRQVLSSCKDDVDTLRHLSLLARKGYLSQGRGVVRVLFRSPENAEAFIKNGFQCLGEASYVRWPDLMPAEMGLELYSELLRLSTEYKPDSKMLIYVAICVVSEAPGTATAPVKWERQLVSRCAKLKLCKSVLTEFSDQLQQTANAQETSTTEILILTFNSQKANSAQREIISTNIQTLLNRRGVILRKHYPEIFQRLQSFVEGQNDRFMPVTIHPRDTQTGQGFVCIIMPTHGENEQFHLPNSDSGNRVSTIDVGEELLES